MRVLIVALRSRDENVDIDWMEFSSSRFLRTVTVYCNRHRFMNDDEKVNYFASLGLSLVFDMVASNHHVW